MKKVLLTLGSLAAVVGPVVSVVACTNKSTPHKTLEESPTTASPEHPIVSIDTSGDIDSVIIDTGE